MLSLVGVVTNVTSAITGAVVSGKISSLLEHEETSTAMLTIRINQDNKLSYYSSLENIEEVRLKRDMRIMYKTLFIFFLHQ